METRVPFLDNDLVDFAMQLPVKYKLGNLAEVVKLNENEPGAKNARYFQKTSDGKLLLRKMMGSLIGGLPETQEMLDHCAKHGITSDIELIPAEKINEAYERTLKSDVKYRFVIDCKTL